MPTPRILKFGESSDEAETEEDNDGEEDLITVRFPQAGYGLALGKKISNIRIHNIRPVLQRDQKPKLQIFTISKSTKK